MKLTVDPEADALYLRLNDAEIADSEQVASGETLSDALTRTLPREFPAPVADFQVACRFEIFHYFVHAIAALMQLEP